MAGLYIHIPYCHSKCAYCDFYSRPDDGNITLLADAIAREYDIRKSELREPLQTIYIGGGTPSILPDDVLARIVTAVRPAGVSLREFTIEANPEDINPRRLDCWRSLGIDRVSMGVQSLNDGELKAVGRRHSAAMALDAIDMIQQAGFDKISCDLIYGLPTQTVESWRDSLSRLLDTGISHLSAYSLSYEEGTLLYARMISGRVTPADDDTVAMMYESLTAMAAERGFRHYEISNFALPGFEAIHNSSYWDSTPYLGLGPSAHSFDGSVRRVNPASVKQYLQQMPSFEVESESTTDRLNDIIITALRTDTGLDPAALPAACRNEVERSARKWLNRSMLVYQNDRIVIPERYWLMADAIMRDLIIV